MSAPSLGSDVKTVLGRWMEALPRLNCQTIVGHLVAGGGTYEFRERSLYRVFPPTPETLASFRRATPQEESDVEEGIRRGWLQILDQPVSGVQYGAGRPGLGTLVLHQATGREIPAEPQEPSSMPGATEQPGPPRESERQRRDIEWVRISQARYVEGYKARMAAPHPMKKGRDGKELNQREQRWSYADLAETRCPGKRLNLRKEPFWPAHECERWVAGWMHADNLAATKGAAAMDRGDPSRPPPRAKRERIAEPLDAFPETVLTREQMRERAETERRKRDRELYERRAS